MTGDDDNKRRPVMSAAFWAMLGLSAMSASTLLSIWPFIADFAVATSHRSGA